MNAQPSPTERMSLDSSKDFDTYFFAADGLSKALYGKTVAELTDSPNAAIDSMKQSFSVCAPVASALQSVRLVRANELWEALGNVPVNDDEEIESTFLQFNAGTDRMEIWHWFESEFNCSGAKDLMGLN